MEIYFPLKHIFWNVYYQENTFEQSLKKFLEHSRKNKKIQKNIRKVQKSQKNLVIVLTIFATASPVIF